MRTQTRFIRRLAAALALATLGSMLSAVADDLDAVTRLIMPAPYEVTATGIGPSAIGITWKDVSRLDQAFELQWTSTPTNSESWAPATQFPIEMNACSGDNFGTLPFVDATNTDAPLNQYNDPQPVRCRVVLTSLRNLANNANVTFPFAHAATNVRWFRMRGIFPYKTGVRGVPVAPVDAPAQIRGILHSPWSGIDPAILGPVPPTNVQALPAFPSLQLVWANAATGDPAFVANEVERRSSVSQAISGTRVPSSSVTYLDGPLEYNVTFRYRIIAVRQIVLAKPGDPNTGSDDTPAHVEESYSPSHPENGGLTITTPPIPAPGDPINLIAVFFAPSTAVLTWFDTANDEDGFLIEFGPRNNDWKAQTAIGPNQGTGFVTFSQFNINPDVERWYRVFAYRVAPYGKSSPSNSARIISIPKAPSNLVQQSVTSFQTVLQFKDNSNYEDGFRVEYCNPSGFSCPDVGAGDWAQAGNLLPASVNVGGTVSFTDGRFALSTLKYRAVAFNASGDSAPSNVVSSTTPSAPLNPPSNLVAQADPQNPNKIKLTWQDNTNDADGQPNTADDQEEAFVIEYAAPGMPYQFLANTASNTQLAFDLTVAGRTTRCYRVRAAIPSQNRRSDPSNRSCATTVSGPIPNAPSNLIAVPWSVNPTMAVELNWNDNAGPDTSQYSEDGFIVEHSPDLQTWREVGRTVRNVTSFRIGNYLPNSFQYFRVKAFNNGGASAYSNSAQVLLKGPPRPVWQHPAKDGEIVATQCYIDGTFTRGFSPPINDIQIVIVRKFGLDTGTYTCTSTPGSCDYQKPTLLDPSIPQELPQPDPNQVSIDLAAGTFRLNYHFRKNIIYELHAKARNADGFSADAFIPSFTVVADCPGG